MSLGTGALALIGGTVVIVGFLTLSAGALVAVQGYDALADVGVEALIGFASAFINVRLVAPLIAAVGLAATIGAGATAQTRRDADQRGDRRAGSDGCAVDRLPGVHHGCIAGVIVVIPLYLRRGADVVPGRRGCHHRVLRAVHRRLRPLLQHVPESDGPALVVRRW